MLLLINSDLKEFRNGLGLYLTSKNSPNMSHYRQDFYFLGQSVHKKMQEYHVKFEMLKPSWIIGGSTGSTQLSPRRAGFATLTRRTCQNPQFSMTKIKWIDPETSSG